MSKYDHYFIDNDIFRNRKHIIYLYGVKNNIACVVASYSSKTKHIIIKDDEIPQTSILNKLLEEGKKLD